MATTVRRDCFARGEYKRFSKAGSDTCLWCGTSPRLLYAYVWWRDAKAEPRDDNGKWFCNLQCFEAYGPH